jgi:hypothetical protein
LHVPRREAEADALAGDEAAPPLAHAFLLDAFDSQHGHANAHGLVATALAWHPRGAALLVAYGAHNTPGFCALPGLLCQWSLARDAGASAAAPLRPQLRVSTECALAAVACHPHFPALVAAGTANGGVLVWDLSLDDAGQQVGRSDTATLAVGHQQGVVALEWVHSGDEARRHAAAAMGSLLCSVGRHAACAMLACATHGLCTLLSEPRTVYQDRR